MGSGVGWVGQYPDIELDRVRADQSPSDVRIPDWTSMDQKWSYKVRNSGPQHPTENDEKV